MIISAVGIRVRRAGCDLDNGDLLEFIDRGWPETYPCQCTVNRRAGVVFKTPDVNVMQGALDGSKDGRCR